MIGAILADDNAPLRAVLRALVETYPARIIADVGNGSDAVRAAENERPDLVILDISMPVMNGLVAARQIHAIYRDVPIIIVTNHREPIYIEEAFRWGVQGYVLKGKARTELFPAIHDVMAGHHHGDTAA